MNRIKKTVVSTKDFVVRHKTGVAVTLTAAVLITANRLAIRDYQSFLDRNGLHDQFIQEMMSAV